MEAFKLDSLTSSLDTNLLPLAISSDLLTGNSRWYLNIENMLDGLVAPNSIY